MTTTTLDITNLDFVLCDGMTFGHDECRADRIDCIALAARAWLDTVTDNGCTLSPLDAYGPMPGSGYAQLPSREPNRLSRGATSRRTPYSHAWNWQDVAGAILDIPDHRTVHVSFDYPPPTGEPDTSVPPPLACPGCGKR